jgi:hypothetical protein
MEAYDITMLFVPALLNQLVDLTDSQQGGRAIGDDLNAIVF